MNRDTLLALIDKACKGLDYEGFMTWFMNIAIQKELVAQGLSESFASQITFKRYDNRSNYFTLQYKGYGICCFIAHKVKKQLTEYRFGRNYRFVIKDMVLADPEQQDFDLMKKITSIEVNIYDNGVKKQKEEERMFAIYKELYEKHGKDLWSILNYLNKHEYDFRKRIEGK